MEKLQKTLKNTRKRKREWSGSQAGAKRERSGSEAGAKRERRGRQENHGKPWKKRWNHRIRFVPAPLPLRSGSVPASSPWSLNATMIISMSRCQGLLPRKNHQKTRVVYQGQFTHQKNHQVVATKKSPWNPRSVNATMIIPIYIYIHTLHTSFSCDISSPKHGMTGPCTS